MTFTKMGTNNLDQTYWQNRYIQNEIGWDIGRISPPIKAYIDQLKNTSKKILIPGAGNSYEAEYLWKKGYKNIAVADIAKQPLLNLKQRVLDFPEAQLLHSNFFELNGQYDLIIEQTFFCALHPQLRPKYAEKMHELLRPKGRLVGLLFNFELSENGPPFGGSIPEYSHLFKEQFEICKLEPSINSIIERKGKELFFIFEKKTSWL